jgi:hypothetical protein
MLIRRTSLRPGSWSDAVLPAELSGTLRVRLRRKRFMGLIPPVSTVAPHVEGENRGQEPSSEPGHVLFKTRVVERPSAVLSERSESK